MNAASQKDYEAVIGLEVHVQLLTESKLFCGCSTRFGDPPNHNVCPVCLGHPGALPVTNRAAARLAARVALATGCTIRHRSVWARKNYFYPDLPKAYQISQYAEPFSEHGRLSLHGHGIDKIARIARIHLEEDAGKSKHGDGAAAGSESRIDLNRCGVPLIEIVGEPDLISPAEAVAYLATLKQLVEYLEVSDGNMEEGSFRCDANVSVRRRGETALGVRTEIKNVNSFRYVEKAIEFEIERHVALLESGRAVEQETRLWDEAANVTRGMRGKEEAHDYRYFPDPDLPDLLVTDEWIERVRAQLPELPDARRERFVRDYELVPETAALLTQTRATADFYESAVPVAGDARLVANWLQSELLGRLHRAERSLDASPVGPEALGRLVAKIRSGALSGKLGKHALDEMMETGDEVEAVMARHGWEVVSDTGALESLARGVVAAHPEEAATYRAGKTKLLQFFIGQVMKASRGQANPKELAPILQSVLSSEESGTSAGQGSGAPEHGSGRESDQGGSE